MKRDEQAKKSHRDRSRERMKRVYHEQKSNPEWLAAKRAKDAKYSARARQFCAEYKTNNGCVDCGYNEHPAALDFDHKDGKLKLGHVSRMANLAKIKEETDKCEVRCANCHRIKTYERQIAAGQTAHVFGGNK